MSSFQRLHKPKSRRHFRAIRTRRSIAIQVRITPLLDTTVNTTTPKRPLSPTSGPASSSMRIFVEHLALICAATSCRGTSWLNESVSQKSPQGIDLAVQELSELVQFGILQRPKERGGAVVDQVGSFIRFDLHQRHPKRNVERCPRVDIENVVCDDRITNQVKAAPLRLSRAGSRQPLVDLCKDHQTPCVAYPFDGRANLAPGSVPLQETLNKARIESIQLKFKGSLEDLVAL